MSPGPRYTLVLTGRKLQHQERQHQDLINFRKMIRGELIEFKPNPNRATVHIYEDISGGCTLLKSELKNASGYMNEGILISMVSGIGHLCKTAALWNRAESDATGVRICKQNEFRVNDFISDSLFTMTSRRIIDINRENVSYDFVSIGSGFNVSGVAGLIMVETASSGTSGVNSSLRYIPCGIGVSESPLNLERMNAGMGVMVRGTVRQNQMPYPLDESLTQHLPLIRFI